MTEYVLVMALVFLANAVPAFAPPTWTLLVWFELSYSLSGIALVLLGVLAATAGRALLAYYMRHLTRWMPRRYVENMHSAGSYLMQTRGRLAATLALFFVSPLSSAQLFAAAGIMKSVRLRPLLLAFALGRTITYSSYVAGARLVKRSSVGDILLESLRSPWAIAIQVFMVLIVVALGMRRWSHDEQPRRQESG
ncbi:MAG: hypothetical protein ACYC3W_05335 [Candidatus Nanopelagicales bacterium]